MTDNNEKPPFKMIREMEFVAHCLVHADKYISHQPRPLNLGHGRVAIDLGRAVCNGPGCHGTSNWLTIQVYETNWDKATHEQWKAAMQHALLTEMGQAKSDDTESDDTESGDTESGATESISEEVTSDSTVSE